MSDSKREARQPKPRAPSEGSASQDHDEMESRNIWLAGLGALAQAQANGNKVFEGLVREGVAAQQAAHERVQEMTQRMEAFNRQVAASAAPQWPRLESIFEARVSRALEAIGVPGKTDWANLVARVEALESAGVKPAESGKTSSSAAPSRTRAPRR